MKKTITIALLVTLTAEGGVGALKVLRHERGQDTKIERLQGQISLLKAKVADRSEAYQFVRKVTDDGFDYLALGNSITQHSITDFWWGRYGMAASTEAHDYYHLVVTGIEDMLSADINTIAYNYSVWEVQEHDRSETYEFLDKWLTLGIDLITVQLSENAKDLSTYQADLKSLLLHIAEKCGEGCQLIVIDDFWSAEKHELKARVCDELGVMFVDLSDIQGKKQYQAGMGTVVAGEHVIDHNGVASHPGDLEPVFIKCKTCYNIMYYE